MQVPLTISKFVGLLEEKESEHHEIIYHTNFGCLSLCSILKTFFSLLKDITFFMKKNKNIELDDKFWISDLAFLVVLTSHLNSLNKNLQDKDKFIKEIFDKNTLKFKL